MSSQRSKTGAPVKNVNEAAANTILTKTVRTKEKIKKKTRGLWDTARQLKGLSDLLASPLKEPDDISGQPSPLVELNIAPDDKLLELKTEVNKATGRDRSQKKQIIPTVKPSNKRVVKLVNKSSGKTGKQPKEKTKQNMELRTGKTVAVLPTNPTEAIPDISAREILKELKGIEKLIWERQTESAPKAEKRKG